MTKTDKTGRKSRIALVLAFALAALPLAGATAAHAASTSASGNYVIIYCPTKGFAPYGLYYHGPHSSGFARYVGAAYGVTEWSFGTYNNPETVTLTAGCSNPWSNYGQITIVAGQAVQHFYIDCRNARPNQWCTTGRF
jgi:hypothetical protein